MKTTLAMTASALAILGYADTRITFDFEQDEIRDLWNGLSVHAKEQAENVLLGYILLGGYGDRFKRGGFGLTPGVATSRDWGDLGYGTWQSYRPADKSVGRFPTPNYDDWYRAATEYSRGFQPGRVQTGLDWYKPVGRSTSGFSTDGFKVSRSWNLQRPVQKSTSALSKPAVSTYSGYGDWYNKPVVKSYNKPVIKSYSAFQPGRAKASTGNGFGQIISRGANSSGGYGGSSTVNYSGAAGASAPNIVSKGGSSGPGSGGRGGSSTVTSYGGYGPQNISSQGGSGGSGLYGGAGGDSRVVSYGGSGKGHISSVGGKGGSSYGGGIGGKGGAGYAYSDMRGGSGDNIAVGRGGAGGDAIGGGLGGEGGTGMGVAVNQGSGQPIGIGVGGKGGITKGHGQVGGQGGSSKGYGTGQQTGKDGKGISISIGKAGFGGGEAGSTGFAYGQ